MKADVLDLNGKRAKTIELPEQFNEEIRPDLIKLAVLELQARKRQKYGARLNAGKIHSATLSKRRRDYKGIYGRGASRTPRKVLTKRGTQFYYVGAVAPQTVGGRRAHPPKAEKNWTKKINIKERKKAIRSAISASCLKEWVSQRGHKFDTVPLIVDSSFENVKTTKEVKNILEKFGLKNELNRTSKTKIRAGKGKLRGRKYKTKTGPLIVVSQKCDIIKSAENIPGVCISVVNFLNAEVLAPGTSPGRLTIWSERAIEKLKEQNLFMSVKKVKGPAKKLEPKKEQKSKNKESKTKGEAKEIKGEAE